MRSVADELDEEEIKSGWTTGRKKTCIKFNRDRASFEIDEDFFDIIKINEQERRDAIEKIYGRTAARLSRMSTANSQSDSDTGGFNLEESKSQVYTIVEPTIEPLALNASISQD